MEWIPQIAQAAALIVLAIITWQQKQEKDALTRAKSAEGSALAELGVWKESAERLGKENRELIAAKSALEAKTSLDPILARIAQWETESRGHFLQCMTRLDEIHKEQVDAMRDVSEVLKSLVVRA